MSISVSAPDSGISLLNTAAIIFLNTLAIIACNTVINGRSKAKPKDTSSEYEVEEIDAADSREGTAESKNGGKFNAKSSRLPHPASPSFDELEFLFVRHPSPDQRNLSLCRTEMESLADEIMNVGDLAMQSKKVAYEVSINVPFYHWCFYHTLFTLELQLQGDNLGVDMNDKAVNFYKAVKAAWILADILDYSTRGDKYQKYLQRKYIQLSTDYLGRALEVTTPIDVNEVEKVPVRTLNPKPAGPAETE